MAGRDVCTIHGVKHRAGSDAAQRCTAVQETTDGDAVALPLVTIHADDLHFVLATHGRLDRVGAGITAVSLPGITPATLVDWREVTDMLTWCPTLEHAAERLTAWANEPMFA